MPLIYRSTPVEPSTPMRNRVRLLAIASIIVLLLSNLTFRTIDAQEIGSQTEIGSPSYDGLDLVFLVDQSGSMERNDPHSQRANTIKWVLQYLGIDNLYARQDANHRVGIVSFGTEATTDLPLTSLKTIDENDWNTLYNDLQSKAIAKDMTNTDVLLGLEEVLRVFETAPPRPPGSTSTKGIIILTDGAPYRDGWQDDPRYAGTNFYTPYFRDIRTFIDENLPRASESRSVDGFHIWVLGLNNTEDSGQTPAPGTSWVDQKAYWDSVVNPFSNVDRVRRIDSDRNAKLPDPVVRVLDTMMVGGVCNDSENPTDKPSCIIEENFIVPPYVARADFSVFKPGPGSEIAFFTPDGQLLDRNGSAVKVTETGEVIETISVENPTPGQWRWQKVDSSAGTATVVFQPLFAQANLVEPSKSQDLFDTVTLNVELRDLSGQRIKELDQYPIVASARVIDPSGQSTSFEMLSQGDGTWQATQSMVLDQPGNYRVSLTGTTKNAAGDEVNLFRNWGTTFSVGNLKPSLASPSGDVPLFHQVPIQINLTKTDGSEPGQDPQRSVIVQADLIDPNGSATPLELEIGSTPNSYQAVEPITIFEPGRYTVRARGTMDFAGNTAHLFDEPLHFRVMAIKPTVSSPSGDQPQNGVSSLTVEIQNDTGSAYVEDPSLPWEITATIQQPDGSTLPPVPLTKVADGRYEAEFSPDTPGHWNVTTAGTIALPDGSENVAFSDLSKTFDVYPTTLVRLNVVSPQNNERQPLRDLPRIFPLPEDVIGQIAPSPVVMEFVDGSGRPLNLAALSSNPDDAVVLQLQEPDRSGVSRPITLGVSSDNPTQLVAAVPDLRAGGEYKLLVVPGDLNREYLPEGTWPLEIVFQRYDRWSTVTYVVLAIEVFVLGLILYMIARSIIVRINPVRGTLELEKVGGTGRSSYGTLPLSGYGKNTFVIKDSKLRTLLEPEAADSLSKLKIKNATERSKSTDEFDTGAGLDGSAIRIWAWSSDKDPIISDEMLANNQSTMLHGNLQIRYHRD